MFLSFFANLSETFKFLVKWWIALIILVFKDTPGKEISIQVSISRVTCDPCKFQCISWRASNT